MFLSATLFFIKFVSADDGGLFQVTIEKDPLNPIPGITVYLFDESGTYLGLNQVSDSTGTVGFNLSEGTYKVWADYLGYQFWSDNTLVTADTDISLTIPHQDVTITVEGDYLGTEPIEGVPVFLFTAAATYMSQNQTTDANGQVVFNLPEQPYKVRADYMVQQYWSNEFTWQDTAITVPMAEAEVQVTGSGLPLEDVNVYVFTASGTYLNLVASTDSSGTVTFRLPADTYKFRADYQSSQYWSAEETLIAGQLNPVSISTGVVEDSDDDGITDIDETSIYGTDPHLADTDGDGIDDGDELTYWGANWNVDYDSDGFNNLLDDDADNDGVLDSEEIAKGFDPADPNSTPSATTSYIIVTIDHTKIDADLADFPVMLKLNESNAQDFFDRIVSDPTHSMKFRIEDSPGSQCYVEKVFWDYTNRLAILYVKVPLVSATEDTTLKLLYDETMLDNDTYIGETGTVAAQNVWDSIFVGVWHLGESGNGAGGEYKDSTANQNNCQGGDGDSNKTPI